MGDDYCLNRHATGGSIPGVLPRLPDAQLNVTQSINNHGNVGCPKKLIVLVISSKISSLDV